MEDAPTQDELRALVRRMSVAENNELQMARELLPRLIEELNEAKSEITFLRQKLADAPENKTEG